MKLNSILLHGVKITTSKIDDLLGFVSQYLDKTRSQSPLIIATPNPEQIVIAQKNKKFCQILNISDITLPDGVGIIWAARLVYGSKLEVRSIRRISGIDFIEELVNLAAKKDYSVGFIGGRDKVSQKALDLLKIKYPRLTGWAEASPEIEQENDELLTQKGTLQNLLHEILAQIKKTQTKIIFVGLGAPKQEYFIRALSHQLSALGLPIVLMSVGGAFDMLSGKIRRAPNLWQHLGIEWLWRLILEPWRLKRQLRLVQFVLLTLRARFMLQ